MAAAWARALGQTLRDALAFDRPGRFPLRDPITGEMTGWGGARAPLPAVDPGLAAAFPGRSPRELLGALERGRGTLYDALRAYARTAPRPAAPPRVPGGPGSRIGAAGLWDCRRTRPTFYTCLADGEQFRRSPWGRLKVNPLPPGFGQTLRGLIRQGLRPRDAMREAWRRVRLAAEPERWPVRVQRRRYAMRRTAFPGANPGAAWHKGRKHDAEREFRSARAQRDRRMQALWTGHFQAHEESEAASRAWGMNPQVAFDPFDYDSPAVAKKARDARYRELRAKGIPARRSVLHGQLEKYRGLGVPGRGIRDIYYLTWADPAPPGTPVEVPWPRENPRRPRRPSRATYCPEQLAPKGRFDPRSFRTVVSDGHRVTVGCPKGEYDARRRRCKVGTRAQRILHPSGEAVCPLPGREVRPRNPWRGRLLIGGRPELAGRARGPFGSEAEARQELRAVAGRIRQETRAPVRRRLWFTKNPPRAVELYRRVEFIGATKGPGGRHAGERFLHKFKAPARILGLPDGSLLIQPTRGR